MESKNNAEMDAKEASRYRKVAARLSYLAVERPDLLFASKCVSKNMTQPRCEDWNSPKRVGRSSYEGNDENGAAIQLDRRRHHTPRIL